MPIKTIALYTADPWESAMCVLRVRGPARQAGISVIQGNRGDQISLECVSDADVVVIQRDFPRFAEYDTVIDRAHAEKKLVLYEVDDLILEVPAYHVLRPAYVDVLFRILRGVVEADIVITSTELLQKYFSQFNPNTWMVPNLLDDSLWGLQPPKPVENSEKPVVLGYMGGGSHLPDLEMVKPVIVRLLEDYGPRVVCRFWGVKPPSDLMEHPNVEWFPLDLLDYAEFVRYFLQQECDVFIAPLLDNFFNRSKSQIKFLEYSALGVAGVYSRFEPYTSVVAHGNNGFLAATPDEWQAYLRQLIDSPELRYRLASNAQGTVRQGWLLSTRYSEWVSAYERGLTFPEKLDPMRSSQTQAMLRINTQIASHQIDLEKQIAELVGLVGDTERQRLAAEQSAKDAGEALARTQQTLDETERSLAALRDQLEQVYQSRTWRIGSRLARVFRSVFPKKS